MTDKPEGLLAGILSGLPIQGLGIQPKLGQRDITIEMTEAQFTALALDKTPPEAKNAISIRFTEGKMTITVRLW